MCFRTSTSACLCLLISEFLTATWRSCSSAAHHLTSHSADAPAEPPWSVSMCVLLCYSVVTGILKWWWYKKKNFRKSDTMNWSSEWIETYTFRPMMNKLLAISIVLIAVQPVNNIYIEENIKPWYSGKFCSFNKHNIFLWVGSRFMAVCSWTTSELLVILHKGIY